MTTRVTIDVTRAALLPRERKSGSTLESIEAAVTEHRDNFGDVEDWTNTNFNFDYSTYGEDRSDVEHELEALEEYASDHGFSAMKAQFDRLTAEARAMAEQLRDAADRAEAADSECEIIAAEIDSAITTIEAARPRTRRADEFQSAEVQRLYSEYEALLAAGDSAWDAAKSAARQWWQELEAVAAAYEQACLEAGVQEDQIPWPKYGNHPGAGDWLNLAQS